MGSLLIGPFCSHGRREWHGRVIPSFPCTACTSGAPTSGCCIVTHLQEQSLARPRPKGSKLPHLPDIPRAVRTGTARHVSSHCPAVKHKHSRQQTQQQSILPHTVPCYARRQRPQTRHRQVSTCAPAPLLGRRRALLLDVALIACPRHHAHARRRCWAQGRRRRRRQTMRRRPAARPCTAAAAARPCTAAAAAITATAHGAGPQAALDQETCPWARTCRMFVAEPASRPCNTRSYHGSPTESAESGSGTCRPGPP